MHKKVANPIAKWQSGTVFKIVFLFTFDSQLFVPNGKTEKRINTLQANLLVRWKKLLNQLINENTRYWFPTVPYKYENQRIKREP